MRPSLHALLALAAGALACSRAPAVPAEPAPPPGTTTETGDVPAAGDTLRVPLGRSATHAASGVRATLLAVLSDNRCPIDALCVTAGDAPVRVRLTRGAQTSDTTLHWGPQPGGGLHAVDVGPWRVTYSALTPMPQASAPRPAGVIDTLWLIVTPVAP